MCMTDLLILSNHDLQIGQEKENFKVCDYTTGIQGEQDAAESPLDSVNESTAL